MRSNALTRASGALMKISISKMLQEEILEDGSSRTVLRLPSVVAPMKAAILPLVKKDGLQEIAKERHVKKKSI